MITPEQRRKLESEWSSDDRSIVAMARIMKGAVLTLLVLTLTWIGASDNRPSDAQEASRAAPKPASQQPQEASTVQASKDMGQSQSTHRN